MLSEIILGTIVPLLLVYPYIQPKLDSMMQLLSSACMYYTQVKEEVKNEYATKNIVQLTPIIVYRFIKNGSCLFLSLYMNADSKHIHYVSGGMCLTYKLNGETYVVLLPTKDKSHEITLLEAYGISYSESVASSSSSTSEKDTETDTETELDEEDKQDITTLMNSIMGPDRDFHSQKITPKLLGYDEIIVRYVDGDLNEKELSFSVDDTMSFSSAS